MNLKPSEPYDHADLPSWIPKPGKVDTTINGVLMAGFAFFFAALFVG
ncbi:hypothetical protein OPU71_05170 [Niveibacterium sp. 24ML]|nr:hypothetical protein [Niveibacterium sp. 24ML]MCX9155512.1 hypothetical protein [Niveibacterium sp. 24ML]